ncbi:MAG: sensor histidine kinase [Bacteroidetes bacterium]|nr:MAG: sensor histidine kinase [Bacteroidota bacterium]
MDTTLPWKYRHFFWNIQHWQFWLAATLFVLFGIVYWLTLMINTGFTWNPWAQTLINFSLKGLVSLPFYWITFVRLKHLALHKRLLLHVLLAPAYVFCWLYSYHALANVFGVGYMWGYPMVWDVFIPLLLYIIQFAIIHAYEYYHGLQQARQNAHQLKELAYQSDINALKAQMQPHFLFNTLNSISASVPPENENTRMLIAQLADTFRFALRTSQEEWVPLKDEISFVTNYLQLEQRRFADRLQVQLQVAPEAYGYQIPSMLLQPLVENAIKHGVAPSMQPVLISIEAQVADGHLQLTIGDTGVGLPPNSQPEALFSKGVGLGNTQQRLQKQFGTTVLLKPNSPRGVSVSIFLPVNKLPHAPALQSIDYR